MSRAKTQQKQQSKTPLAPGVISPNEVYRLDEFLKRVGWSDTAWRTARLNGMKVIRCQGRSYIRGSDFWDYLDGIARESEEND